MKEKFRVNVNTWLRLASGVLALLFGVFIMCFAYAIQNRLLVMIQISLVLAAMLAAAFSGTLLYVVKLRQGIEERKHDLPLVAAAAQIGYLTVTEGDEETRD